MRAYIFSRNRMRFLPRPHRGQEIDAARNARLAHWRLQRCRAGDLPLATWHARH